VYPEQPDASLHKSQHSEGLLALRADDSRFAPLLFWLGLVEHELAGVGEGGDGGSDGGPGRFK